VKVSKADVAAMFVVQNAAFESVLENLLQVSWCCVVTLMTLACLPDFLVVVAQHCGEICEI
jgi:hypothetical protein